MVKTIQNGASKIKLVHTLLLTVVALAFWAGRISMRVDVNTGHIAEMGSDIRYIRNYLMEWEPINATQRKTQSKAKAEEKGQEKG